MGIRGARGLREGIARPVAAVACALAAPLVVLAIAGAAPPKPAAPRTGPAIWKAECAPCHGDSGEGAAGYPKPLAGTRSVAELAGVVARTMPPGTRRLPATEAKAVAAHAHATFYSPVARERNRPARVVLSRLTAAQFRNAVSDLLAGPGPVATVAPGAGLRAEYHKARRFSPQERLLDRVDPEVRFDYGTAAPVEGKGFDPYQFSIRWSGALVAPDTGEYEFVVHSDHSVQLWVNDLATPLIDRSVKSGKDTEFRASVFLSAGRAYPIRLDFTKSTQGVDDTKTQSKRPVPPAFVRLAWRRPKLAEEVIPARFLSPAGARPRHVVSTPFPPDDRSRGYERGDAVSAAWDEAVTSAALDASAAVVRTLRERIGVPPEAPDRRAKAIAWCENFVERAFRRPLDTETRETLVARTFEETPDTDRAVRKVVVLALKSPRFLYLPAPGEDDAWARASRLSFTLQDTLPDEPLRQAAARGELATAEGMRAQARRLAADPRGTAKLTEFLLTWLRLESVPDLVKDPKVAPGFDAAVANDLRASLEWFLADRLAAPGADFRQLMLSDTVFLNGRLAALYGVPLPADAPFQPVVLDPGKRAGVLTQPYVLSAFAYLAGSSPIHRGVLVVRGMLGRTLAPPPVAVAPAAASLHPGLTTRERVALQTRPAACASCHSVINPVGFALEHFDAIGRWRDTDQGKPVDARGAIRTPAGRTVRFDGARELARSLLESEETAPAFAARCFQHLAKQPLRAYGPQASAQLARRFADAGYDMKTLAAEAAVLAAAAPAIPSRTTQR